MQPPTCKPTTTILQTVWDFLALVTWSLSIFLFISIGGFAAYYAHSTFLTKLRIIEGRFLEDDRLWHDVCLPAKQADQRSYFVPDGICSQAALSMQLFKDADGRRQEAMTQVIDQYLEMSGLKGLCGDGMCRMQLIIMCEWVRGTVFGTLSFVALLLGLGWIFFASKAKKSKDKFVLDIQSLRAANGQHLPFSIGEGKKFD